MKSLMLPRLCTNLLPDRGGDYVPARHHEWYDGNMVGAQAIEAAAAAVIPTLAFILNWRMRARNGYAFSAAADAALAIAGFDLAAVVSNTVFSEAVRNPVFKHQFVILMVIFFCLVIIAWITVFLDLEHRMTEGYDFSRKCYISERPMGSFLLGWTLLGIFLAAHIFVFVYE